MNETLRIFFILVKKNFQVRGKCWFRSIGVQVILSIGLFLMGQSIGLFTGAPPEDVDTTTYYPIKSKEEILMRTNWINLIRFTPENRMTIDLMARTQKCLKYKPKVNGTVDEDTMVKDLISDSSRSSYMTSIGIIFETLSGNSVPTNFKYKIRSRDPLRMDLYDSQENGMLADTFNFSPIMALQLCVDEAYIDWVSESSSQFKKLQPKIFMQQMPYPPYTKMGADMSIGTQAFSEIIKFIFLIILCIEMAYPANEKHIGINILMSVNGVTTGMNLFSWLLSAALFSTLYLAPFVVIMVYFGPNNAVPFLTRGNPFIVWLVLFVNICHVFSFGYHLSSYFWKPSKGISITFMIWIIINSATTYAASNTLQHFLPYLGVIFPGILFQRMFDEISMYERKLIGLNWSNMFTIGSVHAPAEGSVGVMLIFSIIGILLNFYLAVFIQAIHPGKYGVSRNPFSCFRNKCNDQLDEKKIDLDKTNCIGKQFEEVPRGSSPPGIRIRGLKKTYTRGWTKSSKVEALRGVSMDFYKSQITALLGHNGAGKTTMMSILSGLTSLTDGIVLIDGKNIQQDPISIKNNIGLCPQENMVFPELTVYQHLFFFGTLKARNKNNTELKSEINALLDKMNLTDKRNVIPKQLSGGQKRRLCLAMAVIGDGNVLILDEPTSGMDAQSKREVWDIVLKMRGTKTIIISTHDMEEADILGDRIAIMHTGKLKSYGTSMFLKKLYGDGQVEVTLSVKPWCDSSKIIQEIGISAQLLNQDEGKMVFAIPMAESLPEALDKLESQKQKLGITGMSVSIITLEQVFLRVTREDTDEVDANDQIRSSHKITGFLYFTQCFRAFVIKKVAFMRKNPWTCWLSLLLPCLSCTMMIMAFGEKGPRDGPTSLTLEAYSHPRAFVASSNPYLAHMYGIGVREFGGKTDIIDPEHLSVSDALVQASLRDIGIYRNRYITSAEFNRTGDIMKANGFYSGTAYLGIPIALNALSNAILKALTDDESYRIEVSAQQLPSSWEIDKSEAVDGPMITLAIIVFLAPAIALYVTQPLQEARSGIKQLQNMTGASKIAYWASIFLLDFSQYIISSLLLLASFIIVDISLATHFYRLTEILVFFALMILFGMSMLPFVYMSSFLKKTLNTTINVLSVAPLILGFVEMILVAVTFSWDNNTFKIFRKIQSRLFQLFPYLSFTYGHVSFFGVVSKNARCRRMTNELIEVACISFDECCDAQCSNGDCQNPFPYFVKSPFEEVPSLFTSMMYLLGSSVLFFAIIILIELQIVERIMMKIRRRKAWKANTMGMDELVMKEKAVVADELNKKLNGIFEEENENIFLVHNVRKNYGALEAVKGISFRVKEGECFGLLGVNGAGKSTTFRMLTGEELPNGGQLWLKDFNIENNRTRYLQEMGYCPQQDAIIDTLNTWDHLYLFARLRGVPANQVHDTVKKWIGKLNLTACAAQPSGTYSGGNKRRLNIAIALIGNPSLVLMDEPTTGVDPAARRSLWNTLKICQDSGQSIILTSHSMEECEVLCNRLVIMVNGQLVCVGASQELKQRFGAGYNIHVKLSPNRSYADVDNIKRRIERHLICKLTDENSGFLGYHVTDPEATWTIMYTTLNELKNDYNCIEDFAVLSSTLEQLFIQFARAPDDAPQNNGNAPQKWWQKSTRRAHV
uniref:ABCA3_2 protein n=1 Tax=Fopius arisanus TaxID=64838 RepID=A0A0C9RSV5_9HYME